MPHHQRHGHLWKDDFCKQDAPCTLGDVPDYRTTVANAGHLHKQHSSCFVLLSLTGLGLYNFLVISNWLQWTFINVLIHVFLFQIYSCLTVSSPASYCQLRTHQRVLHIKRNTWVNIFDKIAISYLRAMQYVRWDKRVGSCNKGFIDHGNNGNVCLLRAHFGLSKVK